MTKYFISSIIILAILMIAPTQVKAESTHSDNTEMYDQKSPLKSVPQGALPEAPAEKGHGHPPGMDETPHIHHFHKHRVKKLKKHQHYWVASKVFLAFVHVVLLVLAYLHSVT